MTCSKRATLNSTRLNNPSSAHLLTVLFESNAATLAAFPVALELLLLFSRAKGYREHAVPRFAKGCGPAEPAAHMAFTESFPPSPRETLWEFPSAFALPR